MGFVSQRDFSDLFYSLAYFHYPEGSGPSRRIDPFQLFGNLVLRNDDRSVESAFVEHDVDLNWKTGASLGLDLELELYYDDLRAPLGLPGDSEVPVGSYWYPRFEFDDNVPPGDLVRASVGGGVQRFYDGWRANVRAGPRWNVLPRLGLNASYAFDRVRFRDRGQGFDSHLLRLRANTALNTRVSLNAFVQLSSARHLTAANVRFRYNFREGNDLWIVYNEGWNLERTRVEPALPRTDSRAFIIKYTYTLVR